MAWIDEWLPHWQFDEVHHIRSSASPAALLDAAAAYDPSQDLVINTALSLRGAPARLVAALGWGSAPDPQPRFGLGDFVPLGRHGNKALAYGLAGRFWEPGYGLQPLADAEAFRTHDDADGAKLLLGFVVRREGRSRTHSTLTVLTRAACADEATRRRLAAYWTVIRPMSGLIRQRILADIQRRAEQADAA